MPYSTPWTPAYEASPAGGGSPTGADDELRLLKVMIRERMNSILAPDGQWDNDPIKLISNEENPTNNRTVMYPHTFAVSNNGSIVRTSAYSLIDGDVTIPIPVFGLKNIEGVHIMLNPDGQVVDWYVHLTLFNDPPTNNAFTNGTESGTAIVIRNVLAVSPSFPVNDAAQYVITLDGPPSGSGNTYKYYGMKVVYSGLL